MKIRMLAASALILGSFLLPQGAVASCVITGEAVRLYDTSATTYVYLRQSPLTTYTYYFAITDANLRATARTMLQTGLKTYVVGSATACPTAGDIRYGGLASVLIVNP